MGDTAEFVDIQDEAPTLEVTEDTISLWRIIRHTVFMWLGVLALLLVGALFFKGPLTDLATWIAHTFGAVGILVALALSDTFFIPIPPDALLFAAAASPDISDLPMMIAACVTSTACGSMAYLIGPYIGRIPLLERRIEAYRPRGEAMFAKYGVWAIALAAVSPLPYSMACWLAGIYKMPYKGFFVATLFRIPRIALYYALFLLGW
ncbi:MAG: VTT domain-containing protein [Myxococcota bacterium]